MGVASQRESARLVSCQHGGGFHEWYPGLLATPILSVIRKLRAVSGLAVAGVFVLGMASGGAAW